MNDEVFALYYTAGETPALLKSTQHLHEEIFFKRRDNPYTAVPEMQTCFETVCYRMRKNEYLLGAPDNTLILLFT